MDGNLLFCEANAVFDPKVYETCNI